MSLQIRIAGIDEAEAIFNTHLDIWKSTYDLYFEEEVFKKREASKLKRIEHIKSRMNEGYPYFILCDGVLVVGIMILSIDEHNKIGVIDALYIKEKYHNQGYGSKLLKLGVHHFNKQGLTTLVPCIKGLDSNTFFEKRATKKLKPSLVTISGTDYEENNYLFEGEVKCQK